MNAKCLQHPHLSRTENVYILFQCGLAANESGIYDIRIFTSGFYRLFLDGEEVGEGPARFVADRPEYDRYERFVQAGDHVLSIVLHHYGADNRMLVSGLPHFIQCELMIGNQPIELEWHCRELPAYRHLGRRLNGQLGWAEYIDTTLLPDLRYLGDRLHQVDPVEISHPLVDARPRPKTIPDCIQLPAPSVAIGEGTFSNRFGYEDDDPPVRFMSRDLLPRVPAEGVWRRFDLGKVGLYRPRITIEAPEGAVIEAGYAESLSDGRVFPVIPLSLSTSCHMDRWLSSGGHQTFQSFSPRGFRYLEVHVLHPNVESIKIIESGADQRTLYDKPKGKFICSDSLLNQIWEMGSDTLRACCEDALIDTPTRERGQWTGDAAVVGMETLSVTFGDLSLIRRALRQASSCRREDGPAAGLCPGQDIYVTTYSLYWIRGCLREARLTGDSSLLPELLETAELTIDYFWRYLTDKGVANVEMWNFIDWGHIVNDGDVDVSLNLILLDALQALTTWERELGLVSRAKEREQQYTHLKRIIEQHYLTDEGLLANSVPLDKDNPVSERQAGYHATVLGILYGQCQNNELAIAFVKNHMLDCFPNQLEAPRLSHPAANNKQIITPSFAHFSIQALWEAGEVDFALEQYRVCWGWMISEGLTTLAEVFDLRWSHCHAWSASPTWQLSRYALGLIPEPERGVNCYRFVFQPGSLEYASGIVPLLFSDDVIRIGWMKLPNGTYQYDMETCQPIIVRIQQQDSQQIQILASESATLIESETWAIKGKVELTI